MISALPACPPAPTEATEPQPLGRRARRWSNRPLSLRLSALLALAASLCALLATSATLAIGWWSAERHARDESATLARSIAFALHAPVTFMDEAGVRDAMEVLRTEHSVQGAWVYDSAGVLLYATGAHEPALPGATVGGITRGFLQVSEPVVGARSADRGNEVQGHLVMQLSMAHWRADLRQQALAATGVALLALALSLLASRRFALRLSRPVHQLAEAAGAIARDGHFERHVDPHLAEAGGDEIGRAVRAFNHMIDEIQRRDAALGSLNASLAQEAADARAARQDAEAASQAKTRFLANMSHELRSPLNGVIGAAQLLQMQGVDAQRREELVEIIRASGTNLLGLIESVLDLSRIEAGALQVQADDFNLLEEVDAAVLSAAAPATAKGLRLACIVEPGLAAWRHGDGMRVRQLLLNLLGNAVKFTSDGEVCLRVQPGQSTNEWPDEIQFEVIDTGVGIPPEALPHIFEPFQQADASTTRRFGGSGLGLTICRELAQHMGGRIEVASRIGAGSCFTLTLPLPRSCQAPPAPRPLGLRVAWCEPHPTEARAMESLLLRLGCEAIRCDSPAALRAVMATPDRHGGLPWLVVAVDEARGRALLEACASWLDPARVIAVGAASAPAAGQPALPAALHGLDRKLTRPLLRTALVSRLGSAFGGPSALRPRPGATHRATPAPATTEPAALPLAGRVLLVEDDPINQSVIRSMIEHAGWRCDIAGDGHQALAWLREQPCDLVLMDWQMPELDGLEATRRLRAGAAGPQAQDLPVIGLTANAFAEDRAACLAAGMNDFLTKPVLANHLIALVQRWIRPSAPGATIAPAPLPPLPAARTARPPGATPSHPAAAVVATAAWSTVATPDSTAAAHSEASQAQAQDHDARHESNPPRPDYDPGVLQALPMVADGSDPGFATELLQQFDRRCGEIIDAVQRCLDTDDGATLLRSVHTLKSSAAQVGALALAAEAARQETLLRQGTRPAPGDAQRLSQRAAAFRQSAGLAEAAPAG